MKFWTAMSYSYMTEESDDPDDPNSLDKFIDVLDKRLEKAAKETPGLVAKKERKLGLPSSSIPPMEAPCWAVKCFDTQHSDAENEPEGELFSIYFS